MNAMSVKLELWWRSLKKHEKTMAGIRYDASRLMVTISK